MPSAGELYLRIRKSESAPTVTIHFPIVTRIEDTIRANLTEISTIVYGSANRFVMDLGTQRSFTISAIRINPDSWNDSSDDSDRWSNGEFENRLVDALDFWQNFGYTQGGVWAGGFELEFVSSDEAAYPSFRENVFLTGSFTPSYTRPGQRVLYQMTFAVASMQGDTITTASVTIYLHTTIDGVEYVEERYVPRNYETSVPDYPSEWLSLNSGYSIRGWDTDSGADEVVYRAGERHTFSEDTHLWAVWALPIRVDVFTDYTTTGTITVPAGAATMSIIAIGGGGAAGKSRYLEGYLPDDANITGVYAPGGAGGAGEYVNEGYEVFPGVEMTVRVGRGGVYDQYDPVAATDSVVTYDGRELVRAHAGATGGNTVGATPGAGGARYYAGGHTVVYDWGDGGFVESEIYSQSYGTDGASAGAGVAGRGRAEVFAFGSSTFRYAAVGGGGGGAAPLDAFFSDQSGNRYPATGNYTSKGGDGFIGADTFSEEDNFGRYGGGGGAGFRFWEMDGTQWTWFNRYSQGGDGGDGIVIVLFYEE